MGGYPFLVKKAKAIRTTGNTKHPKETGKPLRRIPNKSHACQGPPQRPLKKELYSTLIGLSRSSPLLGAPIGTRLPLFDYFKIDFTPGLFLLFSFSGGTGPPLGSVYPDVQNWGPSWLSQTPGRPRRSPPEAWGCTAPCGSCS